MEAIEEASSPPVQPTTQLPPTTTELRAFKEKLSDMCQQKEHEEVLRQRLKPIPTRKLVGAVAKDSVRTVDLPGRLDSDVGPGRTDDLHAEAKLAESGAEGNVSKAKAKLHSLMDEQYLMP